MKNLLIPILLISANYLFAQSIKAEITYSTEIEINEQNIFKNVTGGKDVRDAILKEIKKERLYKLWVDGEKSAFSEIDKINNELPAENDLDIRFGNNENLFFYKNLAEKHSYEEVVLDQKYIVKDTLSPYPWKITKEKSILSNLEVRKATFFNPVDSTQITAWYAPKINSSHGPEKYWGLSGTIVKLEITYLSSTSIFKTLKFTPLNINLKVNEIPQFPNKKKILTKDEYIHLQEAIQKRNREMYGDGVETD